MHSSDNRVVHVKTGKLKIILLLLGCMGFVAAGILMIYLARSEPVADAFFLNAIGFLSIGFFGLCGSYPFIKLFDTQPGLILDSIGIVDRSSGVAVGRVAWHDIRAISAIHVVGQSFLTLHLKNPQQYLQRGNFVQRQAHKLNYRFYGSPVQIAAGTLKISFGELMNLVFQYHERYGSDLDRS